jgi:hypothetical protein
MNRIKTNPFVRKHGVCGRRREQRRERVGEHGPAAGGPSQLDRLGDALVLRRGDRRGVAAQANVGAHVGRRTRARRQRIERTDAAAVHGEPTVEEVRSLLVARSRCRRAKHDDNQAPSEVVGARHNIETCRAGEAGLHPVGARIAAKQPIMVRDVPMAELKRADAEEVGMLGKLAQERPGDHRHVAGGRHVGGIVQAVGIDEMRFV